MHFGTFSYAATVVIFTGLAGFLYFIAQFLSPKNVRLLKAEWKIVLWVVLLSVAATGPAEWVALASRAWTYNPERTLHTIFLGAEIETYLFAMLVSLVISIATLAYARREDRRRLLR